MDELRSEDNLNLEWAEAPTLKLSLEDARVLFELLENPPPVSDTLRDAFRRFKMLNIQDDT
jgi:uncharacterized protein (DUF1778 family)